MKLKKKPEVEKINQNQYLEHLIDSYGNLIFSICFQITKDYFEAEDLTQETFLSAYKHSSSFDGKNEKAWISRIATNKCLDYLKSAKRKTIPTSDDYFSTLPTTALSPEETVTGNVVKETLLQMCKNLKPPYNEVAIDYFYHEKEISDIAAETGTNTKTIQTRIYRAKAMLRKLWRKE